MAVFASDTFTASDGTTVDARSPDIGGNYSLHPTFNTGTGRIHANKVRSLNTNYALYYSPAVPSSADYSVYGKFGVNGGPLGSICLYGRLATGAFTCYRVFWNDQTLYLQGVLNGAQTGITSTPMLYSGFSTADIELRMTGSSIQVYVNGGLSLSLTDANITAAGKAGFHVGGQVSTDSVQFTLDNFSAVDTSVVIKPQRPRVNTQAVQRAAVI